MDHIEEFMCVWNKQHPNSQVPAPLSFLDMLNCNQSDGRQVAENMSKDIIVLEAREKALNLQLNHVNFCLSWIKDRKQKLTPHVKVNTETNSQLYDVPKPRKSIQESVDNLTVSQTNNRCRNVRKKSSSCRPPEAIYENVSSAALSAKQIEKDCNDLPIAKQQTEHSNKFIETLTQLCSELSYSEEVALLRAVHITPIQYRDGKDDILGTLLMNKAIDEKNIEPLIKAAGTVNLINWTRRLERFKKPKEEDDAHYAIIKNMVPENGCDSPFVNGSSSPISQQAPSLPPGLPSSSTNNSTQGISKCTPRSHLVAPCSTHQMIRKKVTSLNKVARRKLSLQDSRLSNATQRCESFSPQTFHTNLESYQFMFVIEMTEGHICIDTPVHMATIESVDTFRYMTVSKGQRLDVLGTLPENYLVRNKDGGIGLVSKQICAVMREALPILWQQDWFSQNTSREIASELLKHSSIGTFLIRDCTIQNGDLVLSVKQNNSIGSYKIKVHKGGYTMISNAFFSIADIINSYSSICIDQNKTIQLTKAFLRKY